MAKATALTALCAICSRLAVAHACPGGAPVPSRRTRGYPRLPREAAAERSRPRSSLEEGTPCR
jgi:hypothetical protein